MRREFGLGFGPAGALRGRLGPDDPSLTFDAAAREVRRWPDGAVVGDDVFAVLESVLADDPDGVWVGWFGYGCRTDLPGRSADLGVPDAAWMRVPAGVSAFAADPVASEGTAPAPPPDAVPHWYVAAFDEVQRRLHAGDSYEVNLTFRERHDVIAHPRGVADRLAALAPGAPYAGWLRHGDTWLVSASPETFARVSVAPDAGERIVVSRPIKGTTPRSADPHVDARNAEALRTDERFRAENLMITDLTRNDLAMVCEPGSVVVPALMEVEQHAAVHQSVTTVCGRLRADVATVSAVRAMFPPASMTGAPKERTMRIIDAVEATPRGVYSGAFGWLAGDGAADLGVVIRSLVRAPDGTWLVGTGGGITVHSDAAGEWAEAQLKASRLRSALTGDA